MAPEAQLGSRAIIVHPRHYAAQLQKEKEFAKASRRRSQRSVAADLPPEAWAVVAAHVEGGTELARLCMVSRAARSAVGQEHWKQLCISVWCEYFQQSPVRSAALLTAVYDRELALTMESIAGRLT